MDGTLMVLPIQKGCHVERDGAQHNGVETSLTSSYPGFVAKAGLPEWQRRAQVFSALDLPDERSRARQCYAGWMQARVREVLEPAGQEQEAWRQLRRGWYVGGDGFRERLTEWAKGVVTGKKRESFTGESLHRHDEEEAARWLEKGLACLSVAAEELVVMRKNDVRKQGLAWLLRSRTVVGDAWIVERLQMGHRSNVSRAVAAFRENRTAIRKTKKLLHVCTDLYLGFDQSLRLALSSWLSREVCSLPAHQVALWSRS